MRTVADEKLTSDGLVVTCPFLAAGATRPNVPSKQPVACSSHAGRANNYNDLRRFMRSGQTGFSPLDSPLNSSDQQLARRQVNTLQKIEAIARVP